MTLAGEPSNDIPLSLKSTLVDADGVSYRDFRRTLRPRWWLIWTHVGLAYLALGGILAALVVWDPDLPLAIAATLAAALLIGYVLQFLSNFIHEAGHYNLVPGRARNDFAANLLLAWVLGSSVASYRQVHFQHHRALGTTEDSEISYFDALGMRYLVEGMLGIKAVGASRRRARIEARLAKQAAADERVGGGSRIAWVAIAAVANLALVVALVLLGSVAAAVAWLCGLLLFFPFLSSLRQLLEHRSEDADPGIDYTTVDHGAVNRLFGDGPVSSTYGSAGFNRHALHHWEPNLSYTRLKDVEQYLRRTEVAPLVEERETSYGHTFLRLLEL